MVIIWRPEAHEALKSIYDFYLGIEEKVARKILTAILEAVDRLSVFPEMAPVEQLLIGEPEEFRSIVAHELFKVVYAIDKTGEKIVIVDIWDCRRDPVELCESVQKKQK